MPNSVLLPQPPTFVAVRDLNPPPPPLITPPGGSSIADWLRVRGGGLQGGGVISPLVAWIQTHLHLQTSFIFL